VRGREKEHRFHQAPLGGGTNKGVTALAEKKKNVKQKDYRRPLEKEDEVDGMSEE